MRKFSLCFVLLAGCSCAAETFCDEACYGAPNDAMVSERESSTSYVGAGWERPAGGFSGGDRIIPSRDSGVEFVECECQIIFLRDDPYVCLAEWCFGTECNTIRKLDCFYTGVDPVPY